MADLPNAPPGADRTGAQPSEQGPGTLLRPKLVLPALLGMAIALAPLGHLSAQPVLFLLYRTLLFGAIAVGLWVARTTPGPGLPARVYGLIAGTLGLMLVSLWGNPASLGHGYLEWGEQALLALYLIALARFSGRQTLGWKSTLLAMVVATPAMHLAYGLAVTTGPLSGPFANPNHFASYLLVGFGAAFAVALFHPNRSPRLAAGATGLFLGYGVLATVSRGATLAALAVVLVGLWKLRPKLVLVGGAIMAVVIPLGIVLWNPPVAQKFLDPGERDPYNYSRAQIWASTATMIADQPLLGVGLSQYEHAARKYRFPVDGTIGRFMKRQAIAHSEYLHYAAETGIPATLLLLALLGYFLRRLLRGPPGAGQETVFLDCAALLVIVGISVHAGVENNFQPAIVLTALSVVALASAPLVDGSMIPSPPPNRAAAVAGAVVVLLYIQSSLIPALAYESNAIGQRAYVEGRLEDAARAHRLAIGFRPDDPVLLANLGVVYKEQFLRDRAPHLLDVAEAYFLRAIDSNPAFFPARLEHLYLFLFRLTDNDGRNVAVHRQIASAAEGVLQVDPFVVPVRRNRAEALLQGGDVAAAIEELEIAVTIEPNYIPAHLKLAELYEIRGDAAQGEEHRTRADAIRERYAGTQRLTDYELIILGLEGTR